MSVALERLQKHMALNISTSSDDCGSQCAGSTFVGRGGSFMEEWKPVTGYEAQYEVSNTGNVRRKERNGVAIGSIPSSPLKPWKQYQGYLVVGLSKDGIVKNVLVHRAVCLAFNPNPTGLPVVNHLDGVKDHNAAINLEWCSSSDNNKHAFAAGLKSATIMQGEKHGCAILTEQQVRQIRSEYIPQKMTRKMLAQKYKVSVATIKAIISRRLWSHI